MSKKEIPVYLFTGFLDAGKTTFIQETLEDPGFNDGQKTLLIVTEEGDTEYKPIKFASSNVKIMTLEDEEDLTESWMTNAAALCNAEKVVIEYNGMWVLDQLYNNLPENWTVYQEMTFADARNFVSYNDNMRQLVYDKIKSTESIVFKHMTRDMDQMPLHKIVRQANRRCDIIYEYGPNEIELDNIEDPLPFDMNAKIIDIQDQDYAMWYADMNDNEPNYYGKTVRFKGRTLLGGGLKADEFVIGRHIMTCCVEDIKYCWIPAEYAESFKPRKKHWIMVTGKIRVQRQIPSQNAMPVLTVTALHDADPPEQEVATFY